MRVVDVDVVHVDGIDVYVDGEKDEVCPGCELAEGESFMGGTVGTTVATIENHRGDEDHVAGDDGGGGGIGGVGGGGDGNCDAETTKAALNNVAIFFKNSFFGNLCQNSARMI